jgi:hypothetical protein
MRLTLERDRREQAERLLADLKAIEQWNAAYWRNSDPYVYETSAFLARESRRSEITLQIAVVARSLDPFCRCLLEREECVPIARVKDTSWTKR